MQLVACSTVANSKALLKSAIRSDNPIIFFEHVLLYNIKGETHDGDYCQSQAKAEVWGGVHACLEETKTKKGTVQGGVH